MNPTSNGASPAASVYVWVTAFWHEGAPTGSAELPATQSDERSQSMCPMTPHTTRAADDFTTIHQRMMALRLQRDGKCAIREGRSSADCWCYKAGCDGNSLPCPPPADDDLSG